MPARFVKQHPPQPIMDRAEIVPLGEHTLSAQRRDARDDRASRVPCGMAVDDGEETARAHGRSALSSLGNYLHVTAAIEHVAGDAQANETQRTLLRVLEAGAAAVWTMRRKPVRRLGARGSAVFTAATNFSINVSMGNTFSVRDAFAEGHAFAVPKERILQSNRMAPLLQWCISDIVR
ncbi:hypothetical protein X741_32425 [Mesorhizobium sp. LNHC229A00]|nr:hypothetical protein X741_32425 [Mesorhizobium sp. LNHC229A00]